MPVGTILWRALCHCSGAVYLDVYQLHQMKEWHNELLQWLATEMTTASQEMEVARERQPANVCVPLLPVQLWNRNPEDVPVPPRWHRRVV